MSDRKGHYHEKPGGTFEQHQPLWDIGSPARRHFHLQRSLSENSHQDRNYGHRKEGFPMEIYQGIPKAKLHRKSKVLSTPSLLKHCHKCGCKDPYMNNYNTQTPTYHGYQSLSSNNSGEKVGILVKVKV